jgi:predicted dehydrogenase
MSKHMKQVLKGGIVGCGFFCQHHQEAWRRIPEVEIVAACDLVPERARQAAARAYLSVEEMLDREELDFLDIATRDSSHLQLIQLAAARKIPVICQKPMAPDWETAVEIVEVADAAGIRLMIHENWRWQPWYRAVDRLIGAGEIGPPIGYGFRTRERDGLGENPYPRQSYFRTMPRLLIHEALVHHIDTARFLFGDLTAIYARADHRNPRIAAEDRALIVVAHRNGVDGWIDGHRFLDMDPVRPVMGDAFFEGENGCIQILPNGDVCSGNRILWKNDVTEGYRGDSVRATQQHFITCLRDGAPFESGGREYLHTFAAVEAAYRSIAEHREVAISEIGSLAGVGTEG